MNSPSNAVIEVENLSRSFRRKQALKHVTLHVPAGCVLGSWAKTDLARRRSSGICLER